MPKLKKILPYLLVIFSFFFTIYVMDRNCDYLLNSDLSSEMILGKLLQEEGGVVSKNWLYSTELRVISTQLIYKFCFMLSDNWHNVRVMSIACIMSLLFGSYYFLLSRLGLKKYAWLTGFALLLPFSKEYGEFVLLGGYYAPHIIFIFLTLALFIPYHEKKSIDKALLVTNCVLAILGGLNGVRYVIIIYLPLLFTSIFLHVNNANDESKKLLKRSFWLLLSNSLGVILNAKILGNIFSFQHLEKVSISNDFNFAKFINFSLNSFLAIFGYEGCKNLQSLEILQTLASVTIVFLLIFIIFKSFRLGTDDISHKIVFSFGLLSFLISALSCVATTLAKYNVHYDVCRYLIPSSVVVFPIMAIYLYRSTNIQKFILSTFITCLFINSAYLYYNPVRTTEEACYATNWLLANGYHQGIASISNASPYTELSNGRIEMYSLMSRPDQRDWMGIIHDSLLKHRSKLEYRPQGKLFLLLNDKEASFDAAHLYADPKCLVYHNQGINIYSYNCYEDLLNNVLNKNIIPVMKINYAGSNEELWLNRSQALLTSASRLCGPIVKIDRGSYYLNIDCEISSDAIMYGFASNIFEMEAAGVTKFKLKDGKNKIPLEVRGEDAVIDINILNGTRYNAVIKDIHLSKE